MSWSTRTIANGNKVYGYSSGDKPPMDAAVAVYRTRSGAMPGGEDGYVYEFELKPVARWPLKMLRGRKRGMVKMRNKLGDKLSKQALEDCKEIL